MAANEIPNDADGSAIKRLRDAGSDLNQPMPIEVQFIVPLESDTVIVENRLTLLGFTTRKFFHEDDQDWDVIGTKEMLLSYSSIVELQNQLKDELSDIDCELDGWGTFGNSGGK